MHPFKQCITHYYRRLLVYKPAHIARCHQNDTSSPKFQKTETNLCPLSVEINFKQQWKNSHPPAHTLTNQNAFQSSYLHMFQETQHSWPHPALTLHSSHNYAHIVNQHIYSEWLALKTFRGSTIKLALSHYYRNEPITWTFWHYCIKT